MAVLANITRMQSTAATVWTVPSNVATAIDISDSTQTYMRVQTTTGDQLVEFPGDVDISGSLALPDGAPIELGTGTDLTIQHSGGANAITNTAVLNISILDNQAQSLRIIEGANDYMTFRTTDGDEYITAHKEMSLDAGFVVVDGQTGIWGTDDDVEELWDDATGEYKIRSVANPDMEYRLQTTTPASNESAHYFEADLADAGNSGVFHASQGTGSVALTGTNATAAASATVFGVAGDAAGSSRAAWSVAPLQGVNGGGNYSMFYAPSSVQMGSPAEDWDWAYGSGDDRITFFGTSADGRVQWVSTDDQWRFHNTHATGVTEFRTGTTDTNTAWRVADSGGGELLKVEGDGTTTSFGGRKIKTTDHAGGTQSVAATDHLIRFTASGTLNLSAIEDGRELHIKFTGSSGTLTINRAGADTIDGGTSLVLSTQYAAVTLYGTSTTDWAVF